MDVVQLIAKVRERPPIWNKRIKEHSNRSVVDYCWQEIATEMDVNDLLLRKKWKYLRDQFSVETSKKRPSRSGEDGEPKWPYYKSLLFLKDVIRPRIPTSNVRPKNENEADNLEEVEEDDEERIIITDVKSDPITEVSAEDTIEPSCSRGHTLKRKLSSIYNDVFHLEPDRSQTESDDLLFFKSLLPYVSRIPIESKLRFRSRIHEVVEEFALGLYQSDTSSVGQS